MKKAVFTFLFAIQIITSINSKNIIFDLGGVLFERSLFNSISHIGYYNIARYSLTQLQPYKTLKRKFFDILNSEFPYPPKQNLIKIINENEPIPYPMHENFIGKRKPLEILADVKIAIKKSEIKNLEKDILLKISELIFDPITHSNNYKAIPQATQIFYQCYQNGHKIYILSTWEKESFKLLKAKNQYLFKLCSGKVISGKIGLSKPDQKIYKFLLNKYQLNPRETFFIDDRQENIEAAQKCNINAILCDNIKNVREKLTKFGILN